MTPDFKTLFSASFDNSVRQCLYSGTSSSTFYSGTQDINCICMHPTGKFVAFGGDDRFIRTKKTSGIGTTFSRSGHSARIRSVRFTRCGSYLISGDAAGFLKIWSFNQVSGQLTLHSSPVSPGGAIFAIVLGKGNELLITGAIQSFRRYEFQNGVLRLVNSVRLLRSTYGDINGMCCSPNWKWIVFAADKGYLISTYSGTIKQFVPTQRYCWTCAFSPDSRFVGIGGSSTILFNEINTSSVGKTFITRPTVYANDTVYSLIFPNTERSYLVNSGDSSSSSSASASSSSSSSPSASIPLGSNPFKPTQVLSVGADKKVFLSDFLTGSTINSLSNHSSSVRWVCLSNDARFFFTASFDDTVKMYSSSDFRYCNTIFSSSGDFNTLAVSRDGRFIAAGGDDQAVHVKLLSGTKTAPSSFVKFTNHNKLIRSLCFSKDSKYLLSGDGNGVLCIFNMSTKRLVSKQSSLHSRALYALCRGSGSTIYSGSGDKTVKSFSLSSTGTFSSLSSVSPNMGDVNGLAYNHITKLLAVACDSGLVIYNCTSRSSFVQITKLSSTSMVWSCTWDRTGRYIIGSCSGSKIQVYDSNNSYRLIKTYTANTDSVYCVRACQSTPETD